MILIALFKLLVINIVGYFNRHKKWAMLFMIAQILGLLLALYIIFA
jgi:hypothetical protein